MRRPGSKPCPLTCATPSRSSTASSGSVGGGSTARTLGADASGATLGGSAMVATGATVGASAAGGDPHATRRGSTAAITLRTKRWTPPPGPLFRPLLAFLGRRGRAGLRPRVRLLLILARGVLLLRLVFGLRRLVAHGIHRPSLKCLESTAVRSLTGSSAHFVANNERSAVLSPVVPASS